MGKRIEDLIGLDNREFEEPDSRETRWGLFLQEIDDLLGTGEYDWAAASLQGIADTVEQTRWVTEGQRQAVKNIEAGLAKRRARGGGGRRYEGWRR